MTQDQVENACALLLIDDKPLGSGCLLSSTLVLTCEHVVAEITKETPITVLFEKLNIKVIGFVAESDKERDIAVIKLTKPASVTPIETASNIEIYEFEASKKSGLAIGFPGKLQKNIRSSSKKANLTRKTISMEWRSSHGARWEFYSPDVAAGLGANVHGMSGGPVFVNNRLIGFLSSIIPRKGSPRADMGTLYVSTLDVIKSFTKEKLLGINFVKSTLELIVEDMASWGEYDVFRNTKNKNDIDSLQDGIPYLPLDKIYVPPGAISGTNQYIEEVFKGIVAPSITKNIEKYEDVFLLLQQKIFTLRTSSFLLVVAHFGQGKSLTARMLAKTFTQQWKNNEKTRYLPIFIRCGLIFSLIDFSAIKNEKDFLVIVIKKAMDDFSEKLRCEKFSKIELDYVRNQPKLLIFDGLDEFNFKNNSELDSFFTKIRALADKNCKIVLFSRPGAIPADMLKREEKYKNVSYIGITPFSVQKSLEWIRRWNELSSEKIIFEDIQRNELSDLLNVPILLFMTSVIWNKIKSSDKVTKLSLYEEFCIHIVNGKYRGEQFSQQSKIQNTVTELTDIIISKKFMCNYSGENKNTKAMLWLLSRIAWESHRNTWKKEGNEHVDYFITQGQIKNIPEIQSIKKEFSDNLDTALNSIFLVLQSSFSNQENKLFWGHRSFLEYFIAYYWSDQLQKLAIDTAFSVKQFEDNLINGRLLLPGSENFNFLREMIVKFDDESKKTLITKMNEIFEDNKLSNEINVFYDDNRIYLREAALSIGCSLVEIINERKKYNFQLQDNGKSLRVLLSIFYINKTIYNIKAPFLHVPFLSLIRSDLIGADLREADLREADLSGADLSGADFIILYFIFLDFIFLYFIFLDLIIADLSGADLMMSNLSGADLIRADLSGANLSEANLSGADLREANLSGANLSKANLRVATYSTRTRWPSGFDPVAAGAILWDD